MVKKMTIVTPSAGDIRLLRPVDADLARQVANIRVPMDYEQATRYMDVEVFLDCVATAHRPVVTKTEQGYQCIANRLTVHLHRVLKGNQQKIKCTLRESVSEAEYVSQLIVEYVYLPLIQGYREKAVISGMIQKINDIGPNNLFSHKMSNAKHSAILEIPERTLGVHKGRDKNTNMDDASDYFMDEGV